MAGCCYNVPFTCWFIFLTCRHWDSGEASDKVLSADASCGQPALSAGCSQRGLREVIWREPVCRAPPTATAPLIQVPVRPLQPHQVIGEQEEALQTLLLLPPAPGTKPGTRWVLHKVCRMKCSEAVNLKCLQFASGGDKGENYKLSPTQNLLKL